MRRSKPSVQFPLPSSFSRIVSLRTAVNQSCRVCQPRQSVERCHLILGRFQLVTRCFIGWQFFQFVSHHPFIRSQFHYLRGSLLQHLSRTFRPLKLFAIRLDIVRMKLCLFCCIAWFVHGCSWYVHGCSTLAPSSPEENRRQDDHGQSYDPSNHSTSNGTRMIFICGGQCTGRRGGDDRGRRRSNCNSRCYNLSASNSERRDPLTACAIHG